jgi:predicted transcriptional regulator
MGRQLTVRMSEELAEQLERMARRLRRSRSDVVRLALERFLTEWETPSDAETEAGEGVRPVERVRDLLGAIESGVPDLGKRHREHILQRLRRDSARAEK